MITLSIPENSTNMPINCIVKSIDFLYTSINLSIKIKTLVSYHPAFLLRSPVSKKDAWKDLQLLQKDMNNEAK